MVRVSCWIVNNMEQVIEDRCTLFLALAVTDIIVATLKEDPSWKLVLELLVGALMNPTQVIITKSSKYKYYYHSKPTQEC